MGTDGHVPSAGGGISPRPPARVRRHQPLESRREAAQVLSGRADIRVAACLPRSPQSQDGRGLQGCRDRPDLRVSGTCRCGLCIPETRQPREYRGNSQPHRGRPASRPNAARSQQAAVRQLAPQGAAAGLRTVLDAARELAGSDPRGRRSRIPQVGYRASARGRHFARIPVACGPPPPDAPVALSFLSANHLRRDIRAGSGRGQRRRHPRPGPYRSRRQRRDRFKPAATRGRP